MSPTKLHCHGAVHSAQLHKHRHVLIVLPAARALPDTLPAGEQWRAVLARRDLKPADLGKTPLVLDRPDGGRTACVMIDAGTPRFEKLTLLRKAAMLLLDETPEEIAICLWTDDRDLACDAVYVVLTNGASLPTRKKKAPRPLAQLHVYGAVGERAVGERAVSERAVSERELAPALILAAANTLTRALTVTAPNELTPREYRRRIRAQAKGRDWKVREFDFKALKKMGAGAFCAVAQGSDPDSGNEAAIVHLSWRPKHAQATVALVGKGICFDTGGHNLKSAKSMAGMHEDMNGSAVALGLLQAVSELGLPVAVDAWLPIAHNHLSPAAYKQNDVVTALDGTAIEIVHTDAEGRMVLADSLTLAARAKPDLIIDFATLTGSMHYALGSRYSGVFASSDSLAAGAVEAGRRSGERVCVFPMDADYEAELESAVADIKQCTLEGEADHILAARFLQRFVGSTPWLHVDLSASSCKGGLGALGSEVTGFGVAWGLQFLLGWIAATP